MKSQTIIRSALASGLAIAAFGVAAPSAEADLDATFGGNQVVMCTGTHLIAKLNPAIADGNETEHAARYLKASAKISDGTLTYFGGLPIPADATTCTVDSGIATDQPAQNVKYGLDDQSNGHTTLTLAKVTSSLIGSTQCDATVGTIEGVNDYPTAYPLQGKFQYTFNELDAKLKQIKIQTYVSAYADDGDPGVYHIAGTVIKGPGVGGRYTNAFTFLPTDNEKKNVNLLAGCTDGVPGNALGGELYIGGADSAYDADALPQAAMVTLGDQYASEVYDADPS